MISSSIIQNVLECKVETGDDLKFLRLTVSRLKRFGLSRFWIWFLCALFSVIGALISNHQGQHHWIGAMFGFLLFLGISALLCLQTAEEEVLLIDDRENECVRIQCRSKDFWGRVHVFRRAHIICDSLLPDQVVINECFVGLSSVRDILGFIAVRDFESSQKPVSQPQHEGDEFVIAFEHFLPRLEAIEMLFCATHDWLVQIANRS